jgi:hypothetical protein
MYLPGIEESLESMAGFPPEFTPAKAGEGRTQGEDRPAGPMYMLRACTYRGKKRALTIFLDPGSNPG